MEKILFSREEIRSEYKSSLKMLTTLKACRKLYGYDRLIDNYGEHMIVKIV